MARVISRETTLQQEMKRLGKESRWLEKLWKIELLSGGIVLLIGLPLGVFGKGWMTAAIGGAFLFLGIAHWMKRGETKGNIGRFAGGARGEEVVSEILEKNLPESYRILNDVTVQSGLRKAQNDHIVLGPNGIFVIETKAYTGRLTGRAEDDTILQVKTFRGKTTETRIKNPVSQNRYHLDVIREKLQAAGLVTDDLKSIVVFTNPRAIVRIEGSEDPVIKPEFLAQVIQESPSRYNYDEEYLDRVMDALQVQ